ncbi:DUF4912 domain-containing protein [Aerosakkonemataceae cyanobacterium BLCC-F154]|uniref:DUF4912 domain-containing protein n=1 Tax=Floridaenema fluviatile BLCC-F154 TaxID=3153640 RepID=A0ABV4YE65_9CYAN
MLHKKNTSIATLALLLALAVVPKPATASQKNQPILAQTSTTTTTIPLQKSVKSGTRVRIDGSSSAATFNQALKQRFEKEYPGTKVNIGYRGTNTALNLLQKGQIDIAAIGRPLTDKEKSLGLVAVPLPRTKIAVVVGPKNTFKGSLTDTQFARIFRGEIRDWSKVGGKRGRIRLIDRPINSDTRQALRNYQVFRNRPFRSGSNTIRVSQDTTSAVVQRLGTNGIGYAISTQVTNQPNVRIVSMHKVSPNDPKYPFSQPIYYVYRRNNPSAAALAFLGFASAPAGEQIVKAAAGVPVATAAPKAVAQKPAAKAIAPTAAPKAVAQKPAAKAIAQTPPKPPIPPAPTPKSTPASFVEPETAIAVGGLGWMWWLIPLLALFGIPLWWLLKNRRTSTNAVDSQTTPPPLTGDTTGETPTENLVPDDTNVTETIVISPSQPSETATTEDTLWGEDFLPTTETQSPITTPPATPDWLGGAAVGGAALAAAAAAARGRDGNSSINLRAENSQEALATWQVSEAHKQATREQGGTKLAIRLYDITDINQIQTEGWQIFQQFPVEEQTNQMLLPILVADRDYNAEIGYLTEEDNQRWLPLAKSQPINIPASLPTVENLYKTSLPVSISVLTPTTPADWGSSMTLTAQGSQLALAAWKVSNRHKQALQQQGGRQLVLRLYDVTETRVDEQIPASFPQFAVDEQATQMLVAIPETNRNYATELGYLTDDNRWLLLARSAPVRIVPSMPVVAEITPTIPSQPINLTPNTSSISLTEFDPQQALAAWQIPEEHKQTLQQQGGTQLALRLYDVTETSTQFPTENWQFFQQFNVDEQASQMLVPIIVSDREYAAEIGYSTEDERWLLLARSAPILISTDTPSNTEIDIAPGVADAVASPPTTSSISLALENPHQIIANWQVSSNHKQALQQQGGRHLVLRLYHVAEINPTQQEPELFQQFAVDEQASEMLLEIPASDSQNFDYTAEIGYLTDDNRWLLLARSAPIPIVSSISPVTEIIPEIPEVTPTLSTTTIEQVSEIENLIPETQDLRHDWNSTIVLIPENSRQAIANWQVSFNHKQALRQQGGRQLAIRLYDVTEIDLAEDNPQIFQQFTADEQTNQILLSIPLIDRDYVAEIGYLTNDENWLMAARSAPLKIASDTIPITEIDLGALGAEVNEVPAIMDDSDTSYSTLHERTQSEIEAAKFNLGSEQFTPEILAAVDEGLPDLPSGYNESRIVLMPRDPQWAYTYWDIPSQHKEELRQQGGAKLALRFYDVTDVDINYQNPHSVQEFECDEMGREWYLPVPVSDRDYIAEIGYLTNDGRWLMLARSNSIHVPPLYPSNLSNDQFITIRWEDELENKQFLDLSSSTQEATTTPSNGFHDSFFGMVPTPNLAAQSVSSYIFPSGIGKWASGVGMMSGVGFSSEVVPESSRNFWLMADAELVVYGATEPDAVITIGGRPIKANSDGTFRFQLSFQDGMLDFPIEAFAPDGEQTRSVHLKFNRDTPLRNTNPKAEE